MYYIRLLTYTDVSSVHCGSTYTPSYRHSPQILPNTVHILIHVHTTYVPILALFLENKCALKSYKSIKKNQKQTNVG